jgi:hypothetical protein
MVTQLVIDPDILERAAQVSGERAHKAAATQAPQKFIMHPEQRRMAELFGQLEWDATFDHKAERSRRQ